MARAVYGELVRHCEADGTVFQLRKHRALQVCVISPAVLLSRLLMHALICHALNVCKHCTVDRADVSTAPILLSITGAAVVCSHRARAQRWQAGGYTGAADQCGQRGRSYRSRSVSFGLIAYRCSRLHAESCGHCYARFGARVRFVTPLPGLPRPGCDLRPQAGMKYSPLSELDMVAVSGLR